jgi:hypothetical protein
MSLHSLFYLSDLITQMKNLTWAAEKSNLRMKF